MTKEITVLAFGVTAEITGERSFVLSGVESTDALTELLEKRFPRLKTVSYAMAVNRQTVTAPAALEAGATVALLPPFSGG